MFYVQNISSNPLEYEVTCLENIYLSIIGNSATPRLNATNISDLLVAEFARTPGIFTINSQINQNNFKKFAATDIKWCLKTTDAVIQ